MLEFYKNLKWLLILAGLGQVALALASLAIPRILQWKNQLAFLPSPLVRQIFWVYAVYIWSFNMAFGLLSLLASHLLLQDNLLATLVCGFIFLYWLGRLLVQFFYFDRSQAPEGKIFKLLEIGLVLLFVYLCGTYGLLTIFHISQ